MAVTPEGTLQRGRDEVVAEAVREGVAVGVGRLVGLVRVGFGAGGRVVVVVGAVVVEVVVAGVVVEVLEPVLVGEADGAPPPQPVSTTRAAAATASAGRLRADRDGASRDGRGRRLTGRSAGSRAGTTGRPSAGPGW